MTSHSLDTLYRKLNSIGFDNKFLKSIQPSWWTNKLRDSPSAVMELKMLMAKALNLDLKSLIDDDTTPTIKNSDSYRFKKRADTNYDSLSSSCAVASGAAKFALGGVKASYDPLPSAGELRDSILENHRFVNLESLLETLWGRGVPVIHISGLPSRPKMDGMAIEYNDRPAIVLASRKAQPAWHLFILAHEIGHIALGHTKNAPIFDEKVSEDGQLDKHEIEANDYAIELLTGNKHSKLHSNGQFISGKSLADSALEFAMKNRIDPGHVVLNHANTQCNHFKVPARTAYGAANKALKMLENDNALDLFKTFFAKGIDSDLMPEDNYQYLIKVSKAEEQTAKVG